MQLNFPKKENGMYILSRDDIDCIATAILKKYYPQNLESPLPLNTIELLEEGEELLYNQDSCFGIILLDEFIAQSISQKLVIEKFKSLDEYKN